MAPDGSVIIDTKMDMSKLPAQLKQLSEKMKEGAQQAEKLVKASLAGIGVAIGALAAATKSYLGTTDKIDKMSQSIGLSKKAYQEWDYILSQNGANIESLEMGMKTLVDQINITNTATDKNATALGQLGISATDSSGNLKAQEDVLKEVITALQNMPAGTEKARLANELLGRSGTELAATLNQTSESTEALRQRAYDLGIVLGDDVVNAGVVLGDTLADIKLLGGGLLNSVIAPLIPQIQEVANGFIEWALEGDKLKEIIAGAFDAIKEAWENGLIKALAAGLGTIVAITTAISILNAVMAANPISLIIIGIGALVAGVIMIYENWNTVYTFLSETAEKLKLNFIILGSKMKEAFLVAVYSIKNGFVQLGLYIAQGFMQKIADLLTLLSKIPFIGEYFETASNGVNGFIDTMELAGEEAQAMTETVIEEAKNEQDAVEDAAKKQIQALKDLAEQRKKTAEDMKNNGTITAPSGSAPSIDVQPVPGLDALIPEAAEEGDDAGKALTSAMSSALDNTSVGVSESIGGIVSNIGAAITIAVGVVKKIFSGIKAVAKFDPAAMYESFLEIIDGLTNLFEKIGSLTIYIDAGKKVLYEFAQGLLENREANAETFRNVLTYMLETAIEIIPAVISLALLILTDFANAVIMNLPLIVQTALEIVNALVLGVLEALPTLLSTLISIIPMILTTLISGVPLLIVGIIGALPEIISAVINALVIAAPEIILALIEALIFSFVLYQPMLILAFLGALLETFMILGEGSEDGGQAILDGIKRGLEKNWNTFIDNIKKMAALIAQPFIDMGNAIAGAFNTIKSSTTAGLSKVGDWFKGLFNAEGTNNFRGGTAIINEEGAEMVTLPSGSKIMTARATAQMQDRAISQLLAGMKTPTFAVAGSGGSRNINISTKVDAPINVDGAVLGRLVFQNIDRAVI